jgi:hypothetical protein
MSKRETGRLLVWGLLQVGMISRSVMRWLFGVFVALVAAHAGWSAEPAAEVTVLIKSALKERHVVRFIYKGHERVVEPHALGKGTDDKPVLLGWQTGGGSQSEPPPGWRVFLITDIQGLAVTKTTFAEPRPDYHKGGRGLVSVDVEVAEK